MKKSGWSLCFISGLFLAFAACKHPEAPEFRGFENARFSKVNAQESLVSADLKFYNPNAYGLQLKRAEMDIYLNDKPANHYLLDSTIHIPGRDTFRVPVILKLDLQSLFSNALQALLSREIKVSLNGKVKLKRGAFPLTVPFHYEGKENIDSLLGPQP